MAPEDRGANFGRHNHPRSLSNTRVWQGRLPKSLHICKDLDHHPCQTVLFDRDWRSSLASRAVDVRRSQLV